MSQPTTNKDALRQFEQRLYDEASLDEPWSLLEDLSTLIRVSGSVDEVAAADYVCDRLDATGVAYERYEPELYISQTHDATIATLNKEFEPGLVKTSFSASTTVSSPVEYVGAASGDLLADDDPREPYQDVDHLTGKTALTKAAASRSARRANSLKRAL